MNKQAIQHLTQADPILAQYLHLVEYTSKKKKKSAEELFSDLCDTIISQQLSGKAAATIFARFKNLFPGLQITAKKLLSLPDEIIRASGCSWAKVRSLKDLAVKVDSGAVDLTHLQNRSDEEVKTTLIQIKGIGPWSAEMFLMFALEREDIFSHGDLGLRNGLMKVYGLKNVPTQQQVIKITSKWSPYRTFASRVLWKVLELR